MDTDRADAKHPRYYLGVDVGGTFTDLAFFDSEGGFTCVKVPSTPSTPGRSTLNGIDEIRTSIGDSPEWASMQHTHSSTVATNALIERKGAVVGLLTTAGFRDIFEIQRLATPNPMRYDSRRPAPLVPRRLVQEVNERIDADGSIRVPLDDAAVVEAAEKLCAAGVTNVVVCFLHSYKNPAHERRARGAIEQAGLGLVVELSSDVWPQAREFERATLTAVNAYVRPIVENYVSFLSEGLNARGIATTPRGARSNGGMEKLSSMARRPVTALLSGPAAGVAGAAAAALDVGWTEADLITIDIGGTSADIGVIRGGRPLLSSEEHVSDFPVLVPTVAVSAIGAGGGSVIWIDDAGALKVGPRSVGADPGPACCGLSDSAEPALTDAFLTAGLLSPTQKLGGRLEIDPQLARRALANVGKRLSLSEIEVADGAIRIAIAMMAAEATNVLARRGVDLPQFRMVAYGGAGPLLAALVAEAIYIDVVLVPPTPGALSAIGAAQADLEGDFVRPVYRLLDELTPELIRKELAGLQHDVDEWLAQETPSLPLLGSALAVSADMRYDGQGYDVTVALDHDWLRTASKEKIAHAFHRAHRTVFGHANEDASIWLKELRAHVVGRLAKPSSNRLPSTGDVEPPATRERPVRFRGVEVAAKVFLREALSEGHRIAGPAIIEQMDATTLIPDGWTALAAAKGSIVLSKDREA
jgi:N-methylhydantoinase A